MALDRELKHLVDYYHSLNMPEFSKATRVDVVRAYMRSIGAKATSEQSPNLHSVEDHFFDTSIAEIRVRSFHPKVNKYKNPLIFFRSSGFVIDNFDDSNAFCAKLAAQCETPVLSIDYPMAPEHPFPEPLQASYETILKIVSQADLFGIESTGFILIGESTGGCIAASVAQMLRDKHGPSIGHQVLLYPVTDSSFKTSSYKNMGKNYILTEDKMRWYFSQYFQNEGDIGSLYALPMNAHNFSNLPKTLIITAQYDPLCDDGKKYAEALKKADVPCEYHCYNDLIHGFFKFNGLPVAEKAFLELTKKIKSYLKESKD